MPERRAVILDEIAALGLALPGSITERYTRCSSLGCRCHADPPLLHGPYLAWTHREGGRQVTRALSEHEAQLLRPLVEADHRLHQLVGELEALALSGVEEILEDTGSGEASR